MIPLQWMFVLVTTVAAYDLDEQEKAYRKKLDDHINYCEKSEMASEDDANAIRNWTMPDSWQGPCMAACIASQLGIVVGGQFYPDRAITAAEAYISKSDPNREQLLEHFKKMAEHCKDIEEFDLCDNIVELKDCFDGKVKY